MLTRRTMLRRTAQAAAFAATTSALAPLFAASASRWFKIGACDWSLGKRGDPAALDVAKQIGLDGIQVDLGTSKDDLHLRKPEVQKAYLEAAKRTGLGIASLAICELNGVPLKSEAKAVTWLADSIDVCKALGLGIVMPPCFAAGDVHMENKREVDGLIRALRQVAPKAEKQGVVVALENTLSAEDNMKIIDRVASPAVKVYYDVGNSTDKGRDVLKEIRALGKLVVEFHAKDGNNMLGHGRIDFKQVRKALDDIEFSGWIQIEAAAPHGLIPDYTADAKYLREIFPAKV
jgi:L-ribulose-5-phosphate 3-epimerase